MEKIVKKFMDHPLSDVDIMNICNNRAQLLCNSQLKYYKDIDEVLGQYGACILLYDLSNGDPGHWSCIFKIDNNTLEFFCSYGLAVDDANSFTHGKNYLSNLLSKSRYKLLYNDYQLQKYSDSISVCGRYIGLRIQLRELPLNEFIDLLIKNKHYNSDFWVTTLTLFCEN